PRRVGAGGVLPGPHRDFVADPETTIRRCLDFAGAPFRTECLRPLRELRTLIAGSPIEPDVDPALWSRALALDTDARAAAAERRGRGRAGRPPRVVMVTDHFPKVSETFFV